MAIELNRTRQISATESKSNGARLLAVDHTVKSKALQEAYHSVVQVLGQSTLTLPTKSTNLLAIRYIYIETNDEIIIEIRNENVGQQVGQKFTLSPLVVNGLATFEADIVATEVKLTNESNSAIRVHVFVAGDTL